MKFKFRKSLKLLLVLSACLVSLTFCSKQKKIGNEVFEGHVYQDKATGKPAAGESVNISACEPRDGRNFCATFGFGSAVTDSEGYFKIEGKPARSGKYFISTRGNNMKEPGEIDSYEQGNIKLYINK
jgi:hypothetical protein